MNYEVNDYDSRYEFENQNGYEDNNRDYEEEYEFQNSYKKYSNNIDTFIPPQRLTNEMNNKINNIHNSFMNISNNISPYEDQNNDNYNYISKTNNDLEENIIPSPLNFIDNNHEINYIKENNSINLLNLTDKIYEDDEHFKKGITTKKNENCDKSIYRKKSSKGTANKRSNKKSLFINNNTNNINKLNNFNGKKNINIKKRRASFMVKYNNKNNFGNFYKLKPRKNSMGMSMYEIEKNNNDTYNEENKKNKNKRINFKPIKEVSSQKGDKSLITKSKNNKIVKNTKKNKTSVGEVENEEKDEKMTAKKSNNNNKTEKINVEKIINENSEKTLNKIKESKEMKEKTEIQCNKKDNKDKNKQKFCFFCCLNSKLDDSEIK